MYLVILLILRKYYVWPIPLVVGFFVQVLAAFVWSYLTTKFYFYMFKRKRSCIVYDERRGLASVINEHGLDKKFDIVKKYHVSEVNDNLALLDGMDVVFLAGVHSKSRNIIIKYCVYNGITSIVIPRVGDMLMASAESMHILHLPVFRLDRYSPAPEFLFIKRFI